MVLRFNPFLRKSKKEGALFMGWWVDGFSIGFRKPGRFWRHLKALGMVVGYKYVSRALKMQFLENLAPTWGPSWAHVGAMLAIKSIFGGPGGRAKTTRKFDTCLNRFGSDFGTIWGGKMEPKSIQDRFQERSWSKCKNLQKSLVFIAFLKIQRFENVQKSFLKRS